MEDGMWFYLVFFVAYVIPLVCALPIPETGMPSSSKRRRTIPLLSVRSCGCRLRFRDRAGPKDQEGSRLVAFLLSALY